MDYLHEHIFINNRTVALSEIISESAVSFTPFETETFTFIKKWLFGETEFTLTTSGSTGTPKAIILTRSQLQQSAYRTIEALGLTNQHTALVCLDTKYIAGKMMLVRALEANMKIIAVEPTSNPFKNLSDSTSIDFTALVPLQLEEILNNPSSTEKLNHVKNIFIGGAALSANLKSQISNLKSNLYATYGMTETVSHIALQRLNGINPTEHFETLPDIKIKMDERDCLVIELPGFTSPIITNDIVRILNDSAFVLLGRYDNVINSGGAKLSPEVIEQKIATIFDSLGYSFAFFLAGAPDERLGQKLVLIVEANSHDDVAISSLLKQHLTGYEVPKQVHFITEFIRTETGKINRLKTLKLLSGQ